MPYEIQWEEKGVFVSFSGLFEYKAYLNANYEIYSDPRSSNIAYIIRDKSGVSESFLSYHEIGMIATHDQIASLRISKIKLAFIAKDKYVNHLCKQYCSQYQTQLTGWELKVSGNIENVRSWIAF